MGATQLPLTTIGIAMGLNARVGMEDNVLFRRGEPVDEQRPARGAHGADRHQLDRRPATPDEARERFGAARAGGRRHADGAGGPAVLKTSAAMIGASWRT